VLSYHACDVGWARDLIQTHNEQPRLRPHCRLQGRGQEDRHRRQDQATTALVAVVHEVLAAEEGLGDALLVVVVPEVLAAEGAVADALLVALAHAARGKPAKWCATAKPSSHHPSFSPSWQGGGREGLQLSHPMPIWEPLDA
jgi:hypothetical protein